VDLPSREGPRIHADEGGELPLGEPRCLPCLTQHVTPVPRRPPGTVAQEADDPGQVADRRGGAVALPLGEGREADAQLPGDLTLEEPEREAPDPDMVTHGSERARQGRIPGFSRP